MLIPPKASQKCPEFPSQHNNRDNYTTLYVAGWLRVKSNFL